MNLRIRQLMISSSNFNNFVAKMLITSVNLAFKLQNAKSQFHSQTEVHLYCIQPQLIKHKVQQLKTLHFI